MSKLKIKVHEASFDKSRAELQGCVVVEIKSNIEELQDWNYLYLDSNGKLSYDLTTEPEFMDKSVAQDIINNADKKQLEKEISAHYGEPATVVDIFYAEDLM